MLTRSTSGDPLLLALIQIAGLLPLMDLSWTDYPRSFDEKIPGIEYDTCHSACESTLTTVLVWVDGNIRSLIALLGRQQ